MREVAPAGAAAPTRTQIETETAANAVANVLVILLPNDELGLELQCLRIACQPAGAGKALKSIGEFFDAGCGAVSGRPFLAGPADFAGPFTDR